MALQLVDVRDGQLVLVSDTIEQLRELSLENTGIIVALGASRVGKGTLLTWALHRLGVEINRDRRFATQAGPRSHTAGIWIWPELLPLPNGRSLLLIDCQGLSLGNESINMQLASLACMMSSLVVFNIEGPLNEEHKTSLHVLNQFVSKIGGPATERKGFMPRLLMRSREYRLQDFKVNFPDLDRRNLSLALSSPEVRSSFDARLEQQLTSERVDPDLALVTGRFREAFPDRHWIITYSASTVEEKRLQTEFVLTEESPFQQSMNHLVDYMVELTEPKLFGGARISMSVLLDSLTHFLSYHAR